VPVGQDNCPNAITAQTAGLGSGSTFLVGTTTETYEVTDAAGNTATCSFTVTVNDTEDPTIACPADITVSNDSGQCGAVVSYSAPAGQDNCPNASTVQTAGLGSGSTFPVGTTTETYEVTDASGNTAQCSFTVTVNDTEDPTISCPADITVNNDQGQCSAVVTYTAPVGTDNCPNSTTAQTGGLGSGGTFPVGTTTESYEVTDASGNTAQCSFSVTVIDNEDPTISCPANITVNNDVGQCSAVVTYTAPTGADNCPNQVTNQTSGLGSGSTFPVGTTTETYEVTDAAGNTATCSLTVTVNDNEDPVITTFPADQALQCDADVPIPDTGLVTATDNCGPVAITHEGDVLSGDKGSTNNPLIIARTYRATDTAGNFVDQTQTITVEDTTDPVITNFPADAPVQCDGDVPAPDTSLVTATDNCGGPVEITHEGDVDDDNTCPRVITRTYRATDEAGNFVDQTQTITVEDTTDPTIDCPADVTVSHTDPTDPGSTGTATANDNCGNVTVAFSDSTDPGQGNAAVITRTWTATDDCGNETSCDQIITVEDTSTPTPTITSTPTRTPFPSPTPTPTIGIAMASDPDLVEFFETLEIFSSVTIAELDGDPQTELVFGTDRTGNDDTGVGIFALNLDGSPVQISSPGKSPGTGSWPVIINVDVRSSPAAADLDNDGLDEIAIGTYGSPNTLLIIDNDGSPLGSAVSTRSVISSPAIGNLDDDPELEIAVGTSDGTLYAVEITGDPINQNWPVALPPAGAPLIVPRNDVDSSPALGDLTGDGVPEIVVLTDDGVVHAYQTDGQPVAGFPFVAPRETFGGTIPVSANFASPLIADVDGDGNLDVIAAMSNGRIYALDADGQMINGFPVRLPLSAKGLDPPRPGDEILSTPAVGDVDGDGLLELAVVFYDGPLNESRLYVFDLDGPALGAEISWPTFQGNTLRTGLLRSGSDGDCNGDGVITIVDLFCILQNWYRNAAMPGFDKRIDFDNSGRGDGNDLIRYLEIRVQPGAEQE